MDINDVINFLDILIKELDEELKAISQVAALDAIGLVITRIQEEGIGKKYSEKKVPAFLLLLDESRLDTEKTKKFVRAKAKAKDPEDRYTNWQEVRQAHGNQTSFVDLTFTGNMFRHVHIIDVKKVGEYWVTTIGGMDRETQDKLRWNAARYGDFFLVKPEEQELILASIQKQLLDFLTKKGLR